MITSQTPNRQQHDHFNIRGASTACEIRPVNVWTLVSTDNQIFIYYYVNKMDGIKMSKFSWIRCDLNAGCAISEMNTYLSSHWTLIAAQDPSINRHFGYRCHRAQTFMYYIYIYSILLNFTMSHDSVKIWSMFSCDTFARCVPSSPTRHENLAAVCLCGCYPNSNKLRQRTIDTLSTVSSSLWWSPCTASHMWWKTIQLCA